ncbi:hypothetical protein AURDEDRAFT_188133 [Auricularia subglabra TFB-10046 SS5]|uniref:Uncharacterized protein n=1 Tax=Auricularia subglabra (strain TFB-10046 / SS5) TaxID=717982 RepID=J0WVM4_AURST|nr:hypothetical protein AURDEDRAFT_188133 [Auricularia subglabra TFB-10046 SS5]
MLHPSSHTTRQEDGWKAKFLGRYLTLWVARVPYWLETIDLEHPPLVKSICVGCASRPASLPSPVHVYPPRQLPRTHPVLYYAGYTASQGWLDFTHYRTIDWESLKKLCVLSESTGMPWPAISRRGWDASFGYLADPKTSGWPWSSGGLSGADHELGDGVYITDAMETARGFANNNAAVNAGTTPMLCGIFARSSATRKSSLNKVWLPNTIIRDSSDPEGTLQSLHELGAIRLQDASVEILKEDGQIDVYTGDPVCGKTLDAVLPHIKLCYPILVPASHTSHGMSPDVVQPWIVGHASSYNDRPDPVYNLVHFLALHIRERYSEEFYDVAPGKLARGDLKYNETVARVLEETQKLILNDFKPISHILQLHAVAPPLPPKRMAKDEVRIKDEDWDRWFLAYVDWATDDIPPLTIEGMER